MTLVHVRDGDHFDFRDCLAVIQMDLLDLIRADYTYAQFIVHASLI